jgi:hypothetical protein
MSRSRMFSLLTLALAPTWLAAAQAPGAASASVPSLSAAVIVQRNIAARGGQSAWNAIQSLEWSGKMEAGGNNQRQVKIPGMQPAAVNQTPNAQVQLPFTLDLKRGHKTRLELQFNGLTAVQVYDGAQGWKVRPFLNRHQVEPFSAAEARIAADQVDLDGLLMDYAGKSTRVDVEGVEAVEGKPAYKLKVTLKSGHILHDWVDAQSFLEVKMDGVPRKLDGRVRQVSIYMRDYRSVGAVRLPHVIETAVQGVERTEKIVIEKATVNPPMQDSRFAKPV